MTLVNFTFTLTVFSQDTTKENIPVDTTYYFYRYDTAPRYIPLTTIAYTKDGAELPSTGNSMQSSGEIGLMAIQTHIPTSFEPDRNKNVGEIAIQESISPTGGLNYNVPLQALPGRSRLPVSLSLTYSSQGGNGFMGYGWNLGGLSQIQEVSTNIYYNT
ncbi:MAG: hypothetical protein H3C48_17195, partial [Chitinophagaceae bacterium]|nr:hypothetical protein [Chitinophagaceae bacterium]